VRGYADRAVVVELAVVMMMSCRGRHGRQNQREKKNYEQPSLHRPPFVEKSRITTRNAA